MKQRNPMKGTSFNQTQRLVIAAVMLALGLFLPFLTGQIPQFGRMLLPMHFPVFLGAFLLGPVWGLVLGAVTPLLRSLLFTMPPMVPIATTMACEMATYGLVAGLMNGALKRESMTSYVRLLVSLLISMLVGRIVYGLVFWLFVNRAWTFQAFLAATVVSAWPGILLQLILIPPIIKAVEEARLGRA